MLTYIYRIERGQAMLRKIESTGNDVDEKPKLICKKKNDTEAREACKDHHSKACKLAVNAGRPSPQIAFA